MKKSYKVISSFGLGEMFIEHLNTLECAKQVFDKAIKDECEVCYLLETKADLSFCGDSYNKILKSYKCE